MKNPDKQFILTYLNSLDFVDKGKQADGHHRITHNEITKGSLYVGNEYISGTGDDYAKIKDKIPPSSLDGKGYPEWRGDKVLRLLEYLESGFF